MVQKFVDWCLPFVFAAGLVALVVANPDPLARNKLCEVWSACFQSPNPVFWNNVIYELGLAAAVSVFFYWLLVKLPESTKRKRLKAYLLASYEAFRKDAIFQFLFASGQLSVDPDLVEELHSQTSFREYFEQPSARVQGDRWHDVANGIEAHHRRELFVIMSILRDDILYVLNNTDVTDKEAFLVLHRLTKAIAAHDPRLEDHDDDKMLLHLFWQIMAGWNPVKGYEAEDMIDRIIRRI